VRVDPRAPTTWKRKQAAATTKDAYEFLARMKTYGAKAIGARATVSRNGAGEQWLELSFGEGVGVSGEELETTLGQLRTLVAEGQVAIEAMALEFPTGQDLLDWVVAVRTELKPNEVVQG
jgi:hypothetical protein